MSSRQDILARIRQQRLPETAYPAPTGNWITFADRVAQFSQVLQSVGGQVHVLSPGEELIQVLRSLPCLQDARQIVCALPDVPLGNVDCEPGSDPHALAGVDVAIVPGEFGVAENGAVWVEGCRVPPRAVLFLTQHLVLVTPRDQLVDHLHAAYERIRFAEPGYGLFISGPSKTADIEQSLVIGAHGPRSCTVVLT